MSFVPVKLRLAYRTIAQANPCDALQLAPALSAILFPKGLELTNARSNGNDLHTRERPDDLEVHDAIVENISGKDNSCQARGTPTPR